MKRRTIVIAIGSAAVVVAATGTGVAIANNDDNEAPITGDALDKASAAALAQTGGGQVSETEVDDEDSYYEVEVTLPDGSQIDIQLDEDFNVVGEEIDDDDNEADHDDNNDDNETDDDNEADDDD